jgi:UDP-N-acetylmuramate dehydrogenase
MDWFAGLEAICRPDVPLADLTWYRLGGAARWLLAPRNTDELADVLRRCRAAGVAWRVLGRGANVLVSDAGFDGAVITLTAPDFTQVAWDPPRVTAGAGAEFPKLCKEAATRGLGGLEGLAGIPGSVGGIIRMNAGGKYGCIADVAESVQVMAADGTVRTLPATEVGFRYRDTSLHDGIVLGATLHLRPGDPETLLAEFRRVWHEKHTDQPPVSVRCAGCIFKNPPGGAAGRLLDRAGLKGVRRGAAEISTRHANFILAHPGARAQDVLDLILHAKERVRQEFGVELELEVDLW